MTVFTIPRGQARALFASLLPHAGKQSDDTPEYGRARFAPGAENLIGWTLDGATAAACWVDVIDHQDDGAEIFDLSTSAMRAALAVFRGPSDADARQMWEDQPLQVELARDVVVLSEVEEILDGRSLTVERVVTTGEDRYPDVPSTIAQLGDLDPRPALVSADALARFIPSAKAWNGRLLLASTIDPGRVEVAVGERVLGVCPRLRLDDNADTARQAWAGRLRPLRREVGS